MSDKKDQPKEESKEEPRQQAQYQGTFRDGRQIKTPERRSTPEDPP